MDVTLSLHKGRERGDTVSNEVVRPAQDVEVRLGQLRPESHHLDLQQAGQQLVPIGVILRAFSVWQIWSEQ